MKIIKPEGLIKRIFEKKSPVDITKDVIVVPCDISNKTYPQQKNEDELIEKRGYLKRFIDYASEKIERIIDNPHR